MLDHLRCEEIEKRERNFSQDFLTSGKMANPRLGIRVLPGLGPDKRLVVEPDVDLSGIVGRQCFCCNQPATTKTQDGKWNVCAEHTWFAFHSYSSYRGEHE